MRTDTRRPGITLIEVLAAIFIMGVGLLAILVLFPLGALNMARALRDDRCGYIAQNAGAIAIAKDLHSDFTLAQNMTQAPTNAPPGTYLPPDPGGPSYPVFVDPYYASQVGFAQLSNLAQSPVQRITAPYATTQQQLDLYFGLLDDVSYEFDGRPKNVGGGLERQGYYTWSYMFRRSVTLSPSTTEMYVIVYSGRPVLVPQQEPFYDLVTPGQPGETSIILDGAGANGMPRLRRGYWLFDISYRANPTNTYGRVNSFFYRVVEATPISATQVRVELDPPLRNDAYYTMTRVVSLENAIQVFERGTGR